MEAYHEHHYPNYRYYKCYIELVVEKYFYSIV